MSNSWEVRKYKPREIQEKLDNKTFVVPRYQRGIVWKDSQRSELVDTIKKGLPFGTLTLYEDEENIYQIIDGLQRSTALKEFVNNPAQFFNADDIDDTVIFKIVSMTGVSGNKNTISDKVKDLLVEWVYSHDTLDKVETMQFSRFGQVISKEFPTCQGKEFDIGDLVTPMLQNFQMICKQINDTEVPAIVISGDESLLPVLFERINSKGTQLTKYQIYAASWNKTKYSIDTEFIDLVKANRDRYDLMNSGEVIVDDYDPVEFINDMRLDAFEIAFGFGKYLRKNWPHLFGDENEERQVESIGFNLINCCLGQRNKDAAKMNTVLKERIGNEGINQFLSKILDAVRFVDKRVGKYSQFKSNSRPDSGKHPLHTEFQIVSLIASVFILKYAAVEYEDDDSIKSIEFNFDTPNSSWRNDESEIKTNMSKIYIMEVLQRRWLGSGDKKMDSVLYNPKYYARPVSKEDFSNAVDIWFANLNAERQEYTKVSAPKESELLMIAVLYLMNQFSADWQMDDSKYDVEHLATKALMKEQLGRFDGNLRLPISSFGNLCLLPQFENRSKGKKTLYQDEEYLNKSKYDLAYIEKHFSFTEPDDLDWILDESIPEEEFKEAYFSFISKRYKRMMKVILDNYNKI